MTTDNFHVLTGAMGSGKSALLSRLEEVGIACVPEPAREILAEQRRIDGMGVPEKNANLFSMLMLSRSIHHYATRSAMEGVVVFDRGIPDMIAYARLFDLDETPYAKAAREFRYDPAVFYLPAWEEIYATDSERKMSFQQAQAFGVVVRTIYEEFGYRIVEVPRSSLEDRVQFIQERIVERGCL